MKSFKNWDVYYLQEYAVPFQLHGDGIPFLIDFENEDSHFCYVVMRRDIANDSKFCDSIEKGSFFDFETPYGYGGPLFDSPITNRAQSHFLKGIKQYASEIGLVSQFVRFHPLLVNYDATPLVFETRYLHDTIYIDTSSPELIIQNMDSKNRNMVRKASKNGVTIERRSIEEYNDFIPIYLETMNKDNADDYYFFGKEYFEAQSALKNNACFFYAMYENQPIAGAIMYYNDRFIHYHLAGTITEFRKFAPSNLLLYEAACWACKQGIRQFHLGGGISQNDNLFGFKKQFNKNGKLPFFVGRTIFDEKKYQYLLDVRKRMDPSFDMNNRRMTQYRY